MKPFYQLTVRFLFSIYLVSLLILSNSSFAQTTVSGDQSGEWTKANSPYVLSGGITIPAGQTLTIQPGVELRSMSIGDRIIVNGTLIAKGTAADSIRFVSGYTGLGGTLYLEGDNANSVLDYVVMDRMGENAYYYGVPYAIRIDAGSPTLSHLSIRNSYQNAIHINEGSPNISGVNLINHSLGIYISNNVSSVISGVDFINTPEAINTPASNMCSLTGLNNAVVTIRNSTISSNCTFPKFTGTSYYKMQDGFTVNNTATLTIQPGVELRSMSISDRIIVNGTLIAKGTAADSIRFVSGYTGLGGTLYLEGDNANSVLDYVVMDRMGENAYYYGVPYAIKIDAGSPAISHTSIRNSYQNAIHINGGSSNISGVNLINHSLGIYISNNVSSVISGVDFINTPEAINTPASNMCSLTGLNNAVVTIRNSTISSNCTFPKFTGTSYYKMDGGFTVNASAALTIQPGVELRSMSIGDRIIVNGTLIAKGTAADSIRFVSGYTGLGGTLYLEGDNANSVLDYVVMDRMGENAYYYGVPYAIRIDAGSPTLSHLSIRNSYQNAIHINEGSPNISGVNLINHSLGIYISNNVSSVISGVDFINTPEAINTPASNMCSLTGLNNAVVTIRNSTISSNCTFPKFTGTSYYKMQDGFTVNNTATLTIQPGVELRSMSISDRIIVNGTLIAKGTAADSIRFVSGYTGLGGTLYLEGDNANSVLDYVVMDRMGENAYYYGVPYAIKIDAGSPAISHTSIRNSYSSGIYNNTPSSVFLSNNIYHNQTGFYNAGGKPVLTNCNIYNNSDFGVNNGSGNIADTVDAKNCYWGTVTGPYHPTLNPTGTGNKVSDKVNFIPYTNQPFIFSFSPTGAGTGDTVIIKGDKFEGVTGVTFGGTPAQSFTIVSNSVIAAVVGLGSTGDVQVSAPGGSATRPGFTFCSPFTPSVSIAADHTGLITAGTSVTFTATVANKGYTPTLRWTRNGIKISGVTGTNYSSDSLVNNDTINCVMVSGAPCATKDTIVSNSIILNIQKTNQTVTLTPTPDKEYGNSPFTVNATATSGLPVTLSLIANPAAIASISGSTITINGIGTVIVSAVQEGNANYNPSDIVSDTFVIAKGNPTITLADVPDHIIGDTVILYATVSSGLPFTYSLSTAPSSGVARLLRDTIIADGQGSVTITVTQQGNQYYNDASLQKQFKVLGKPQTITFATIPSKTFGDAPFGLSATASSGLPVAFTVLSGPAIVTRDTITLTGDGTVVVEANQPGNNMFASAPPVQQTFKVTRKYADLTVQNVTSGNTELAPNDSVSVSWKVSNVGEISSAINWTEKIYIQSGLGANRTLIKQVPFTSNGMINAGETISRSDKVIIPAQLNIGDDGVFVVELVPVSATTEAPSDQANNTGVQQAAWAVRKLLRLEVSAAQLTEGSQDGITATVSRTASLSNSLPVNLSFGNAARFAFPSAVTIPAGQSAATFTITATNNNAIEGTITDSLSVSATNFTSAKVTLSILDNDKPSLTFTQLPADAKEGQTVTFKVNTDQTLKQPLQVFLTSANQKRFPVPSSVTIPAGAQSADITVKLEQNNIPELDIAVNIIAGAANHNSTNANIQLKDDDLPGLELVIQTNIISESAGYYATQATLRRTAGSNAVAFTANLSSSPSNTLILPASVTLAAGENEKTFNVGVVDNALVDGDRLVSITASIFVNSCSCSAPSTSSGYVSAKLTVTDNDGPALQITATQITLLEGLSPAGYIRITRNTATTNALSVNLSSSNKGEATVPATVVIAAGETFADVAVTTINDGVPDGNQQVYFQASSANYSTGSIMILVTDANKPDLQIPIVKLANPAVQAMSVFNYRVSVKNSGFATAQAGVIVRGYLSSDDVIDNSDSLISEDITSAAIPAGQTIQILNAAKAPNLPGKYKLIYSVNPTLTLSELVVTNNTSVPAEITIKPDYTVTAVINEIYFLKGNVIPVSGSAKRSDSSAAANEKVEVYFITSGLRRTLSATTDASGRYTAQFIPLANEAGHYTVGASYPGLGASTEQDNFDVLGIRLNGGTVPQFKVILKETVKGTLPVTNLSNTSLTNLSLAAATLPNGAAIQFDVIPVLAGNATLNAGYTITGNSLSQGNNFEVASFKATAQEGNIQAVNVYYYCQAPNAYVEASISNINVTASQSAGERLVEFKLVNKGQGATGDVNIELPQANWLSSITTKKLPSVAPGDTAVVVLKFTALAEVPFDYPINGSIAINTQNGNSINLPFSFKKVSESAGTLKVIATDQFTYYSAGAPKVKDAHVVVKSYYTGQVYVDSMTDAAGALTASGIPEGTYRVIVEKDHHEPYTSTITINAAQTTETSAFLDYQAITFSWNVVPTAIQDEYDITLETQFETNVPKPVVTIDMPKTMPKLSGNETYAFNATLTNHGLITAKEVKLGLPDGDAEYEFVTNYVPTDLLAQQSIQVPVIMRRRTQAGSAGKASFGAISQFLGIDAAQLRGAADGASKCEDFTSVQYWYYCNIFTGLWEQGGALFTYSGRSCVPTPAGTYNGLPVDVGYGGGGSDGYNDVPCATCQPGGLRGQPITTPTPPAKEEKKNCVKCIEAIGDLLGCAGPGTLKDAGKCIAKNLATGEEWSEYNGCIPLPPGLSCIRAVSDIADQCPAIGGSGGAGAGRNSANSPVTLKSSLGAVFDRIIGNLKKVERDMTQREAWLTEYYGDMVKSDALEQLRAYVQPFVTSLDSIRPDKQETVLAAMAGYEIQPDVIKAFFTKWNTSVYAYRQGVLTPNATYPNIINWTKSKSYSDSIVILHKDAVAQGFESVDDMWGKEYKALNEFVDGQHNTVCASVTVQLSQRLTMTREAFEGTLQIFNGHPTEKIDSLSVNIKITDDKGVPSNDLFEIQTKSLTNLTNITGTGIIASKGTAGVKFLFIPETGAAPTASKVYNFSGSVTYLDPYAKAMVTMPLSSVPLTVNPSPNLMLHYFMERNILGDDALTSPEIEPSVPAELAVMIENQGYGPAVNMMISSAQPKIVENEKGLAINFSLIGSNFQGQPKKLGVTDINFGTIPALQTRIGQWYFTSSLLGKFVSYDAKVVHSNSFGNPELSLVKGVKLHELTKSIKLYGSFDDGLNDFLVNDIFDTRDVPDIIYLSQGNRTSKVYEAASGSFSSRVNPPAFTNQLTVKASVAGWNYTKLDDAGKGLYEIASVTRSDGQVIPLNNAWLTFVTLPVSQAPKYENKFHFVDTFSSVDPVTYTVVWKPKNFDVPKIDSIIGAPKEITSTQVQSLKVKFNKRIDPATFTYDDLTLTFQGGQNIINSSVVITQIDTVTFSVDLSKITNGNGFYNFTAQAADVKDVYGINGTVGKQTTWTQFLDVPAVQAFQGIPEGHIATAFDRIQVLFNLPLDVSTVTPARFTVLKDSVLQSGQVTIDSVRADHKLFYLSGLKNILLQNGAYELVVNLPDIKSVNQVPGLQKQSVILTVDNTGPLVLSLEKSKTGALDAQHVPYINIKFNEDVAGFNTSAIVLTRNGEVLPLSIDKLSNTDLRTWMAGNFGTLTYPEGNYTFTIDVSRIKDAIGNTGTGTQQISWTVNRSAIVSVTNLSVTPDLGYSNTDGVTSAQSLSVKFNLSTTASKVIVSQVDLSGEAILTTVSNVAAGAVSVPVILGTGGNMGIKVTATDENGRTGNAAMSLFVDLVSLSGNWLFANNQVLLRQADTIQLSLSAKLLSTEGFLNAVQLKRNGSVVSTSLLTFRALNDSLFEVRGIRSANANQGNYELSFNLPSFSKYSSGKTGDGAVTATWTVQPVNQPPIAKAGTNITVTKPGTVNLNGSGSSDPDADAITYRWVAPSGIVLTDSTSATPSFTVTVADQSNNYSFLLIVSDGKSFATDVVNVSVNITNQEYYRSIITGNWNDPATWQSSSDSISWFAAVVSPNNNSKTITIQSGHTVTVKQNVTTDETIVAPAGILSVDAGSTLTVINNGLTLRSNADNTAMIGTSAGNIAGNVTVDRFIPARRAWRLLTVPLANSQTVNAAWQEGGANLPGYGTHITGESPAKGFDGSTSNGSSIEYYNQQTNTFEPLGSTLTPLSNQPGYFLFVRGDRTVNLSQGRLAPPTNTVLRAMGTLKTGTQPAIPVPAAGFTLTGNPYASAIDFSKISKTNVPDRFFVWDPKRGASGAYVLFDADNGYVPLNSGGSYSGANSLIQSGQAFFVEGSGTAGSIGIAESSKSTGQRNAFRSNDGQDEKLLINLHSVNADNTLTLADATLAKYNNIYSTAVTSEDAGKPENIDENIAIVRSNRNLTIEKRPLIDGSDTIFLKMYNMKEKDYQYEFIPSNFSARSMSAYLEDAYLKTRKSISLDTSVSVRFSITSDAASVNADRFRIVFKSGTEIPVTKVKAKAYIKNAGIQVDWDVAAGNNTDHYEVEKSADGQHFEKAATVVAIENNNADTSYSWFDKNPINGDNYYRIKLADKSGEVKYSNIVSVQTANGKSSITVFPNPVSGKAIFVQLNNQPKGKYIVQLYNNLGQQLMNTIINHPGGPATQKIPLNTIESKGIYQLHITNGETILSRQIIVE